MVGDDDGAVVFADHADALNYGVVDEIARRALKSGARVAAYLRAGSEDHPAAENILEKLALPKPAAPPGCGTRR